MYLTAAAVLLGAISFEGKAHTYQEQGQGQKQDQYRNQTQNRDLDQKQGRSQGMEQKYGSSFQSLPDQSFAVIQRKPDGGVVRLLPHHDANGKVVVPWLEDSMTRIFQLDPKYRAQAREHLLKDYYEKE